MNPSPRLPIARLLVIGLFAPLVMTNANRWLLEQVQQRPSEMWILLITLSALVVEIGVMGWLCARWLDDRRWTWGLYIWCWLLVDLHVLTAAAHVGQVWHARFIPRALLAAQVGLTLIWAILGTTPWMIRFPLCLVAAILLAWPLQIGRGYDGALVWPQLMALSAVCLLLRWRGFCIRQVFDSQGSELALDAKTNRPQHVQFGIRHVLYWTTALAVGLAVLRILDMMSFSSLAKLLPRLDRRGIELLSAGLLIASVYVVAVWASLGSGRWWQRIALLVAVLPTAGFALAVFHYQHYDRMHSYFVRPSFWEHIRRYDLWCIFWTVFAGSLLFASLIILRVLGYRLVRASKPRPAVGVNQV